MAALIMLRILPFERNAISAAVAMLLLLAAGCTKNQTGEAFESNANGYACLKCNERFYTDRSVAAEVCPKCKSPELAEVMGFVCTEDGAVTLVPRGLDLVPCTKCGKPVRELKLPQESELKAWGASRQEKAMVMLKP